MQRLWPEVRFLIGVHPHAAGKFAAAPEAAAQAVEAAIAAQPAARAVGEIGLDYHYDFAPRDAQQAVFRVQIDLARGGGCRSSSTRGRPRTTRSGFSPTNAAGDVPVVFHCFTGGTGRGAASARRGILPVARRHRDLSARPRAQGSGALVPLDRLLIETDSPYLAPVPHRGTRNEPAYVALVAEAVAALRGDATGGSARPRRPRSSRIFNP